MVWLGPAAGCTLYKALGSPPNYVPVRTTLRVKAPLAQSVERFHGKEKVNGSIPLGGSVDAGPTGDSVAAV